ncbi:hypothetical protein SERLADRAFT_466191 [Serpula lacrymans var. lacrymans S7.9]|uniref:RanBD1 domain-containing protein n=1 Tax=Serpula lacrymans var. lacrymans (strain S7.9) TaxID=578457 RepID=F8NTJ6_SERL9|nr:uncharacterized protein SERLADRAFT_466191 [Serpula lacrymans var. lacrymans S7.9]EGO25668.1 hypothetical protein SERLADRAFT_466191 [Serpula lacrymans var. lacrymans S7.9]
MKAEESVGTKSSGNPFAPTSDAPSIPKTSSSPFGTSVPNFFSSSKVTSVSDAPSTKPISAFAPVSSGFGVTTGPISSFSAGSSDTTTSNTTSVFGSSTAFGVADKPSSTSNPFTGFIGNPVGFGFGNQAKDGEEDSAKSSTGFSFGAPPKSSENTASPPAEKSRNATPSENVEGTEEDSSKLLPSTNHDEEGEGEEDEETTHAAKCKVYKMLKTDEKSEWKDMGVGYASFKETQDDRRSAHAAEK